MFSPKRTLFVLLVSFAAACASAGTRPATSADPNVITETELATYSGQPVRYAIQRLRPQFLRTRGTGTITQGAEGIVVYLGTTRMGGLSALDQIPSSSLVRVQYMSPSEASQRFGLNHTSGAIVLTPK